MNREAQIEALARLLIASRPLPEVCCDACGDALPDDGSVVLAPAGVFCTSCVNPKPLTN